MYTPHTQGDQSFSYTQGDPISPDFLRTFDPKITRRRSTVARGGAQRLAWQELESTGGAIGAIDRGQCVLRLVSCCGANGTFG